MARAYCECTPEASKGRRHTWVALRGGGASLAVTIGAESYHLWPHGFAVVATLYHSRSVISSLLASEATLEQLSIQLRANSGHLAIMLRTLSTLGWVTHEQGVYRTTRSVASCAASPTLAALCEDVYGQSSSSERTDIAWGTHLPRLAKWLPSITAGWALPDDAADVPHLLQLLAGSVIAPLLLELRMLSSSYTAKADEGAHEHASPTVSLASVDEATAERIGEFFVSQQWGTYTAASQLLALSEAGLFIIERCPAFGVCLSYRPMLHLLGEATFGSTGSVFRYDGSHEAWVDRKLNVIGSGFMHNRYFADMMSVCVKRIFDEEPLDQQPRVIADMGCGDGTLLKTTYLYIRAETRRGQHLGTHPLTMCGVDFNTDSLKETGSTLTAAGAPHGLMFGDIGDPQPMQANLETQFGVTRDQVLHVRSFLDHDRPFLLAERPLDPLVAHAIDASDAAYVANGASGASGANGRLVTPSQAFASLIEHWERWERCLGRHGLLVLEVSNLDVISTRRYMEESTSMHFDAVQAHSGQLLMPATHFSLGAASAGLLPEEGLLTYPKDAPYTRIVLQQLRPAGITIRLATLSDLPNLLQLEQECNLDGLRAPEGTLRQRLTAHALGQYAATSPEGVLLGAMYTQRVHSYESLLSARRETELGLHTPAGSTLHLLSVVQLPRARVADKLRRFGLLLARLDATIDRACAITRCRSYEPARGLSYQAHVAQGTDPGLLFHTAVLGMLPGCSAQLIPRYHLARDPPTDPRRSLFLA